MELVLECEYAGEEVTGAEKMNTQASVVVASACMHCDTSVPVLFSPETRVEGTLQQCTQASV